MNHEPVIKFTRTMVLEEHTTNLRQALVALDEELRAADIDLEPLIKCPKKRWKKIFEWLESESKQIVREW